MGVKDKLKNVWTQYKVRTEKNKKAALEFYKENIEGKTFKERIKSNPFKVKKF